MRKLHFCMTDRQKMPGFIPVPQCKNTISALLRKIFRFAEYMFAFFFKYVKKISICSKTWSMLSRETEFFVYSENPVFMKSLCPKIYGTLEAVLKIIRGEKKLEFYPFLAGK